MGFVNGTKPCPKKFVVKDGVRSSDISPAYENWVEQDQTILSWINATLTPPILSTVACLSTSHMVWLSLEKRYALQSRTLILQLKNQLQNTKRGDLSISDFVDKITHIDDNLALAGKPVDDEDLITLILNNVGPAYEGIVNSMQARDNPISLDDLIGLLLSAETRMVEHNSISMESIATALFTPRTGQSSRGRGRGFGRGPSRGTHNFQSNRFHPKFHVRTTSNGQD